LRFVSQPAPVSPGWHAIEGPVQGHVPGVEASDHEVCRELLFKHCLDVSPADSDRVTVEVVKADLDVLVEPQTPRKAQGVSDGADSVLCEGQRACLLSGRQRQQRREASLRGVGSREVGVRQDFPCSRSERLTPVGDLVQLVLESCNHTQQLVGVNEVHRSGCFLLGVGLCNFFEGEFGCLQDPGAVLDAFGLLNCSASKAPDSEEGLEERCPHRPAVII